MSAITSHEIDDNTIIFQTYRLYQSNGQVIIATKNTDGHVLFEDLSRGIYGAIPECLLHAGRILEWYDKNIYSLDLEKFGFKYSDCLPLRKLGQEQMHHVPLKQK